MIPAPRSIKINPAPPPPPPGGRKHVRLHPQAVISKFWSRYQSKTRGKVTSIFPKKLYRDVTTSHDVPRRNVLNATQSYEAARAECINMVRKAVAHCERTNTKFVDTEFDIEADWQMREFNCLFGLNKLEEENSSSDDEAAPVGPRSSEVKRSMQTMMRSGLFGTSNVVLNMHRLEHYLGDSDSDDGQPSTPYPQAVHRIPWIFENPQFTVDGYSSSDIKQGAAGDCWWLAAVGNIAHRKDLMDKICVARDEECGVYGFVFYRDGEWIPTIIDDNLYLTSPDFGYHTDIYDARGKKARLHKKQKQTGSESLFYSKCEDENETWLPLLEKAYAKVHGDYHSIHGGWAGTAVEDMTGGVTTLILGNHVLRKDRLWREMMTADQSCGEFVFGLSSSCNSLAGRQNGLILSHAYSILKATEIEDDNGKKIKLVKIRNPWGQRSESGFGEWHGPWSDGSREWTPSIIQKLRHEFGDDGVFWMTFDDVLDNFRWIHRTRLFDERWTVAQHWNSEPISWVQGYLKSKFIVEIRRAGPTVIALSSLDTRYFRGLEGQYRFRLEFIVRKADSTEVLNEARSHSSNSDRRSVNCEFHLEPGIYEVVPKITAERSGDKSVEKMVQTHAERNPKKLRQIGMQYDLAHAKAGVLNEDEVYEQKKSKDRAKRKGPPKHQADKVEQMRNAMQKMQVAINDLQAELNTKGNTRNNNAEAGAGAGTKAAQKAEQNAQAEEVEQPKDGTLEKGVKEDVRSTAKLPSPPGFWPGESFESAVASEPVNSETQAVIIGTRTSGGIDAQQPTSDSGDKPKKTDGEEAKDTSQEGPVPPHDHPLIPAPPLGPGPPVLQKNDTETGSDSDSDSESDSESDVYISEGEGSEKPPWNPVCVMCLRVYAQDEEISIKLIGKDIQKVKKKAEMKKDNDQGGEQDQITKETSAEGEKKD